MPGAEGLGAGLRALGVGAQGPWQALGAPSRPRQREDNSAYPWPSLVRTPRLWDSVPPTGAGESWGALGLRLWGPPGSRGPRSCQSCAGSRPQRDGHPGSGCEAAARLSRAVMGLSARGRDFCGDSVGCLLAGVPPSGTCRPSPGTSGVALLAESPLMPRTVFCRGTGWGVAYSRWGTARSSRPTPSCLCAASPSPGRSPRLRSQPRTCRGTGVTGGAAPPPAGSSKRAGGAASVPAGGHARSLPLLWGSRVSLAPPPRVPGGAGKHLPPAGTRRRGLRGGQSSSFDKGLTPPSGLQVTAVAAYQHRRPAARRGLEVCRR